MLVGSMEGSKVTLYSPVSQLVPLKPSAHVQLYPFVRLVQLPPFLQGDVEHSFIMFIVPGVYLKESYLIMLT